MYKMACILYKQIIRKTIMKDMTSSNHCYASWKLFLQKSYVIYWPWIINKIAQSKHKYIHCVLKMKELWIVVKYNLSELSSIQANFSNNSCEKICMAKRIQKQKQQHSWGIDVLDYCLLVFQSKYLMSTWTN